MTTKLIIFLRQSTEIFLLSYLFITDTCHFLPFFFLNSFRFSVLPAYICVYHVCIWQLEEVRKWHADPLELELLIVVSYRSM